MARPENILEAPIPRPLLWIGTPIAAIVLISIFVFLRFPYGDFAPPLARQLGQLTGSDVRIGDIESRITIGGPGMALRNVRITRPDGQVLDVDPILVRPAWSTSWLSCDPAIKIEVASPIGRLDGVFVLADPPRWTGEVRDLDLARLPVGDLRGLSLSGKLVAAADVLIGPGGPVGPVSFDATSGSITHAALPIALQFESASGDLTLGDEPIATVRAFDVDGPTLFATVTGEVHRALTRGGDQLDLDIRVEVKDPTLRSMLQGMGAPLDARGRGQFKLGGTLAAPRPR